MNKELSVIVVTFNEAENVLRACFGSVRESEVGCELIVVDNGSRKATADIVEAYNGRYVDMGRNAGFAAAVNAGMKVRGARDVLLLNPDARFEKGVLRKVYDRFRGDEDVGIGSSVIRYPDGRLQESIRRFPTVFDQLLILMKVPHVMQSKTIDRYMMRDVDALGTRDVDSIMGAFMLIKGDLIDDIGMFDERYFIWFEEVDYCKMTVDAGWKVRHYGDVEVEHLKGHAFSRQATWRKQRWMRESLRKYVRKHLGFGAWVFFWGMTPVFILMAAVSSVVKPR